MEHDKIFIGIIVIIIALALIGEHYANKKIDMAYQEGYAQALSDYGIER
jgi:hypothetical protein